MTELNDHSNRAHALLSASSAARWLACPPSAIAAEAYPNEETEFTKEGTLAHEVAEKIARISAFCKEVYPEVWPAEITKEMIECAKEYGEYIQEQIKLPSATVLLEQRVDFSPWVPEGFGTADCIIFQADTMDVIDYKYGKGVSVSAVDNPQMKLYGLGALNDYGFAYDIKRVRLHIFQPRLNNISVFELTAEELMDWAEKEVKLTAEKAAKGEGEFNPGEHCRFCPHAGRCRKLQHTCVEYVKTHGLESPLEVLAPWEVAEALRMEPLITLWLKRVKAQALSTMMDGGEIPGYKLVEGKLGNREWADDLRVVEILRDNGYTKEDYTETRLLSPAGMDGAIGKKNVAQLLGGVIVRKPGAPAIVPETDKRSQYNAASEIIKELNN